MKLGTRSKRILVFLVLMPVMVILGKAQSNMAFYPLEDQFNSSNFNPAFLTSPNKFTLSIFPLGGTSIGYNNQKIIQQMVSKLLSGSISDKDYKDILKSLDDRSSFNQNAESSLLSFTYRSNIGFFNFRIKENENFSAIVKGELTDFIIKSGIQSAVINQMQNIPAQVMHYREYSLGYVLPSNGHKFSAGIRAKLYFGKASFFSGISGSIIENQTGMFTLQTRGKANVSVPVSKIFNSDGTLNTDSVLNKTKTINYLMNSGNPGVGIDLGINYRINSDLTFSMSVIDLGKIFWKSNLNSKSFNGEYNFDAGSVKPDFTDAGIPTITKTNGKVSFIDSISTIFDLKIDSSTFSNPLPVTVYTSLKYQLNPSLKICLIDRYVILKNMNYNSFSITASFDVNKKLSVSTGYAIIGNSYYNIPLAFLFKKDFGQIYIGTDNLAVLILSSISEYASFTFGTCFYLFRKRNLSKTTTEDLPFYHPKKIMKYKNNGLIIKEDSNL